MAKMIIEVCAGTYCTMMGSMNLVTAVESLMELDDTDFTCDIEVVVTPCQDELCQHGAMSPVVKIDDEIILKAEPETIMWRLIEKARRCKEQAAGSSLPQED